MTESDDLQNDVPPETSIPGASLESILRTQELHNRPSRSPDYEKENVALVLLANALADSPGTILQTLVDKVFELLRADSAGLSLLTKDETKFYWAAILRLLFITEIALWKYRARLPGFELPENVRVAQRAFDDELARALEGMADRIEGRPSQAKLLEEPLAHLERTVRAYDGSQVQRETAGRFQAFLSLDHGVDSLATSLQKEI